MKRLTSAFGLILFALLTTACVTPIFVLSTHTAKTGPDTEADIIWIQKGELVYRCSNTQSGPVCTPVKELGP